MTDAITAMLAAGHHISGMPIAGRWFDVRDPEVLASLEENYDSFGHGHAGG